MKLSKVLFGSAVMVALMFGFVSCKEEEDELGIIEKVSEDGFTNDGSSAYYARGYVSTATKHLAADCEISIDTSKSDGAYTMGYIFNQIGKGTTEKPYSFVCVGVKYGTTNSNTTKRPLYFISYYKNVLSSDFTTDAGDFDVSEAEAASWSITTGKTVVANSAKECSVVDGWTDIPTGSYTYSDGILKVYIDLAVLSGDSEITTVADAKENTVTEITDEDGSKVKKIADGAYKITLKASSSSSAGTSKVISKASGTDFSDFAVQEAKLGRYAMVSKNATLKGTWNFPKDSYLKSAVSADGSTKIVWENEIDNVR